ncbi:GGDEF domain-containing protein (plasmid) [Streptomyces sp. NBC_01650]|nr:GGDEF domain-containing protein [Streptomyces sp. NBC_01650]
MARHHHDTVVCLVDLDHFKGLNDTHGHAAGDTALAATGERLAQWAGPNGVVGRLGGDEFAVATRRQDGIEQHLQDLVDVLHEPVPTQAGPLPVAASVGAAVPDYSRTWTRRRSTAAAPGAPAPPCRSVPHDGRPHRRHHDPPALGHLHPRREEPREQARELAVARLGPPPRRESETGLHPAA